MLSVVIPCYNEEGNIKRFFDELLHSFDSYPFEKEFVFIDDGSADQTKHFLDKKAATVSHMKVISHASNQGLGAAIQSGIKHSSGDAILVLDADMTFHPREFKHLYEAYDDQIDVVMGSPYKGAMSGVPWVRRCLSHSVNMVYRILFGIPVTSTSSLFRIYRSKRLKETELTKTTFDINAEILFKLVQAGAQVREVPVTLTTRQEGVSKLNTLREIKNHLKMFVQILKWRFVR